MLNITQGNPVPLGIQLRRNGADFVPESEGLRVLLTDYYGSRAIEDVTVADGRILATVPATVRVGKYGIEITGTQAGSPWRTKYNDVLNITDETVEDVSDEPVTMTGDYYDIVLTVNLYGGGDSAELVRLRIEVQELGHDLEDLSTRYNAKVEELGVKTQELTTLQQTHHNYVASHSHTDTEYNTLSAQIETLNGQIATLEGQVSTLTSQLTEKTSQYNAKVEELATANATITSQVAQISVLQADLTAANTQKAELQTMIDACLGLDDELIMTSSITKIGDSAFYTHKNLITVNLANVTEIGAASFYSCSNITSLTANHLKTIEQQGFMGCSSLVKVKLPAIVSYGNNTFANMTSLEVLDLGENLTSVVAGSNAPSITKYIFRATTPPRLIGASYINSTADIYVPDASVEDYKAAANWSSHASQIKGLSEYVED